MVERRQAGLTKPEGQSSGKLSIQFGSLESHLNQVSEWRGRQNWENRFWSFASSSELFFEIWQESIDIGRIRTFFSELTFWIRFLKKQFQLFIQLWKCQESTTSKPTICKVSKVYFINTIKSACVLMKDQVLKTNTLQQYPDTARGWSPLARRTRPEVM